MTDSYPGLFISFEGGEGCGKSTQLPLLARALRASGTREVVESRSPGGTPAAEKIRAVLKTPEPLDPLLPQTELLLFGACHAQMCENLIRPALARGAILLTDRFCDSTLVYQGCARGLDPAFIRTVNDFACRGLHPDLTILLDIDPAFARERIRVRAADSDPDRFDSEIPEFHYAVRAGFLALARTEPERFAVIDANADVQTIHNRITEAVHVRLGIL